LCFSFISPLNVRAFILQIGSFQVFFFFYFFTCYFIYYCYIFLFILFKLSIDLNSSLKFFYFFYMEKKLLQTHRKAPATNFLQLFLNQELQRMHAAWRGHTWARLLEDLSLIKLLAPRSWFLGPGFSNPRSLSKQSIRLCLA
jgi:hypothetical protein